MHDIFAWRGYRVCLRERNEAVVLETTSFANGGQLGPSESSPWSKHEIVRLVPG